MNRLILAALVGFPVAAFAAYPNQDPDWPCQQRLVPEVTAATFWNGPLPMGEAPSDPRIDRLVNAVAPRDVSLDDAKARIAEFLKTVKPKERAAIVPAAFVAIVAEVNRERSDVIGSIKDLTRRQRDIAALVAKADSDLAAIPETAQGEDAAKRDEALQRKTFLARTFEDTRKTMRYACDVPAQLDARLGAIAQQMQANVAGGGS